MDSLDESRNKTAVETENADLLEAIDAAILAMKNTLAVKGCEKGSLADLIRLLQLRKELDGDRPRHVSARWIDECETSTD